jgi:hypothetical protein
MLARDLIGQWRQHFLPLAIRFFDISHRTSKQFCTMIRI